MNKLFRVLTIVLFAAVTSFAQWETIEIDGKVDIDQIFTVDNNVYALIDSEDGLGSEKLYVSTDDGATFTDVSANLPEEIGSIHSGANHNGMVLLGTDVGVYMSSDQGQSWSEKNNGLADSETIHSFDSFKGGLYAGAQGILYKSEDDGESWTEIPFFLSLSKILNIEISDSLYYVLTDVSGEASKGRVFKSADQGQNWDAVYEADNLTDLVSSTHGSLAYLSRRAGGQQISGLISLTDYGENVNPYESFTSIGVTKVVGIGSTLFVGYTRWYDSFESGVMYNTAGDDEGWIVANEGLPDKFIYGMSANETYLFVSNSDSLFARRPLSDFGITTDVKEIDEVPTDFALDQNYPNPFNPSTTIRFSIPKQSNVSLKVYDVIGKEVAELVNSEKAAGSYEVDFNAQNLSSGIYFYTLKAGNLTQSKKMLLIK